MHSMGVFLPFSRLNFDHHSSWEDFIQQRRERGLVHQFKASSTSTSNKIIRSIFIEFFFFKQRFSMRWKWKYDWRISVIIKLTSFNEYFRNLCFTVKKSIRIYLLNDFLVWLKLVHCILQFCHHSYFMFKVFSFKNSLFHLWCNRKDIIILKFFTRHDFHRVFLQG